MKTANVIAIQPKRTRSEDYDFLRKEGLKYLEELSSNIWTDYNEHDPGVTVNEQLCYAITDLGYRTQFPMKDLLAQPNSLAATAPTPLFSAREILTNNPVTMTDFRKILVDTSGIKNAWLQIADGQEVNFYAKCQESVLDYYQSEDKIEVEKLDIRDGLSWVIKKIIDAPDNQGNEKIDFSFTVKSPIPALDSNNNSTTIEVSHSIAMSLPGWDAIQNNREDFLAFLNADSLDEIRLVNSKFDNVGNTLITDIWVRYQSGGQFFTHIFLSISLSNVQQLSVLTAVENYLENIDVQNPIVQYQQHFKKILLRATEHDIQLRGFYDVLLEYEVDLRYGDLNSDLLRHELVLTDKKGKLVSANLEIIFPAWNEIWSNIKQFEPFILSQDLQNINFFNSFSDDVNSTVTTDITIDFDNQGATDSLTFENIVFKGSSDLVELKKDATNIFATFHGKLQKLLTITRVVEKKLHDQRNLCEDYKKISAVPVNQVAICADIILENSASLIQTQAEIIFQIQQYISPPVRFYSLKEMTEKGLPSETIFDGPKLEHGFIISEEIEKSDINNIKIIYASDIINIIQDIAGVIAVKDLILTKYDRAGRPVLPSEKWCLRIDPQHKAELSISKSKLLFFKEDLPYILSDYKFKKMQDEVNKLHVLHSRNKLSALENDFPIPEGTPANFADYTPIRYLLPQTYGVGVSGLPETASAARKGKAKQLAAFLAFFDQLLANYLSQLNNLNQVFSLEKQTSEDLKKTYYNQFLTEENLQVTYTNLNLIQGVANPMHPRGLQRMTESKRDYLDRRNRFLDHLMGRFAEDFTQYALLVFSTKDEDNLQALIDDKVSFLEEYPVISAERGKAFNYKNPQEIWNSNNVVGLKKRVSKLLGMPDYLRKNLHCLTIRDEFIVIPTATGFSFQLQWGDVITHSSPLNFATKDEAFYAKEKAIELAASLDNYRADTISGQFIYQIGTFNQIGATGNLIFLESIGFSSVDAAKNAQSDFHKSIQKDFSATDLYSFSVEEENGLFEVQLLHRNILLLSSPTSLTSEAAVLEEKNKWITALSDFENYRVKNLAGAFVFQVGIFDLTDPLLDVIYGQSVAQFATMAAAENAAQNTYELLKNLSGSNPIFDYLIKKTGGNYSFFLKNGTETIFESQNNYPDKNAVLQAQELVLTLSHAENSYSVQDTGTGFQLQIGRVSRDEATGDILTNEVLAKSSQIFATEADAQQAKQDWQRKFAAKLPCQTEGMHLIEHLLLRPRHEFKNDFLEVCLTKDCFFCGEEDPYSFRASVILPYWLDKFSRDDPKLKRRQYADRILRQEAPAHVHLKICWINNRQMRLLDLHYRRWLEANAVFCPDKAMLTARLNALLDILGKLRNRYPEGFLHDCDDSEEENTILLNKSFLGSYNAPES